MLPALYDLNRFSLFDPLFNGKFDRVTDYTIDTHVYNTNDKTIVEADVPGIEKEALEVQFDNNMLTIVGKRVVADAERHYRTRLKLPDTVGNADIAASLNNGVLMIEIPKHPEKISKRIEIT